MTAPPDSLIYIDGKAPIAEMQRCLVIGEGVGGTYSDRISTNPRWIDTPQEQGVVRQMASPGGLKFGRTQLAPADKDFPAFVFSTYRTDLSNRCRSEVAWPGLPLPYGKDLWIAARLWFDFDLATDGKQHVTAMQIMHGATGARLNPMLGVSFYGDRRIHVAVRHCDVQGMAHADQQTKNFRIDNAPAGEWFDVVVRCRLHWQESANPYFRLWINGVQHVSYTGPFGYRGPASNGKAIRAEMRFGAYPGAVAAWAPDRVRNVYIRRAFVCRNAGKYTAQQIRAKLAE